MGGDACLRRVREWHLLLVTRTWTHVVERLTADLAAPLPELRVGRQVTTSSADADGELKHPFNHRHSYLAAVKSIDQAVLRQILGQPVLNMLRRRQRWGWWSTYREIFLFLLREHQGDIQIQLSHMIPWDQPSTTNKASIREIIAWAYQTNGGTGASSIPVQRRSSMYIGPKRRRPVDRPPHGLRTLDQTAHRVSRRALQQTPRALKRRRLS